MCSQVVRPMLPYFGAIPGGLHEGKLIEVKGTVPYGTDVFSVNLLSGPEPSSDRPLHLSVRFHGRVVVRNHLERDSWGPEERDGPFPFASGRDFALLVLVDSTSYRIAVNGQHCWEFVHRIPMECVSSIFIEGSVDVERIEFVDKINPYQPGVCGLLPPVPAYPGTFIMPGIPPSVPLYPGDETCFLPPPEQRDPRPGFIEPSYLPPVYNPSIPCAYPIYGGLKPGMMIYISGRPSATAHRFTLNLQSGASPYPPPDIAFHFDARFFSRTIVRNSRLNDRWDREEDLCPLFPFHPAVNFDLIIRVDHDRFMVALDGQHLLEFDHRLHPLDRFDTLYIENDIVVSSIRFA